ncbi:MAG: phosphotransferase [Gammaproteobacteria bacterium]|nr:phosphotransferase [Gammaproteobacteria bacterium]
MTRILSLSHQDQERISQLEEWLNSIPDDELTDVRPASSDASFRRYFRVTSENTGRTFIVMDAPPDREDCRPFIHITELLRSVDVNAPAIITMDLEKGFLLLDDLGDRQYLDHLDQQNSGRLYNDALESLVNMQRIKDDLPSYNHQKLLDEMGLFEPWYLNRHLGISLDAEQKATLEGVFQLLIDSALEQPRVFVHRDYHSRNLMLVEDSNPGVIDYQDAVFGPVTYDLVSLFKDCYIEWPRDRVEYWLDQYLQLTAVEIPVDRSRFLRWFDLMGVQRHLKVLGIFARLNYRDGKSQYLGDLPLTLKYVVDTCNQYIELSPLMGLLDNTVLQHPEVNLI